MKFKIPGKVMLNGAYMVLKGEQGISIPVDCYLNVNVEKYENANVIDMKLRDRNYVFEYENETDNWKSKIHHPDSQVFENILNNTIQPIDKGLKIDCSYDDGFWINNNTKTGIGSSACILVMFCRISSWLQNKDINSPIGRSEFVKEVQRVNEIVNKGSSGCDVTVCATGPILYSKDAYSEIKIPEKYLLLGSFGESTSTREMIQKVKVDDFWNNLKKINSDILRIQVEYDKYFGTEHTKREGKSYSNSKSKNRKEIKKSLLARRQMLYEEYLDALYQISKKIVPEKQYKILKETFEMGVPASGVSGSGGEDAVWVLVNSDKLEMIKSMWEEKFSYVKVCRVVAHGVVDE